MSSEPQISKKPAFYKTKWFNLTLGIAVTAACLWWAFQQMLVGEDGKRQTPAEVFAKISSAFGRADYRSLPVMWACLAAFYWLKAIRWQLLLAPLGKFHAWRELFPSTIIGFAFNNVLPAHLGRICPSLRLFTSIRTSSHGSLVQHRAGTHLRRDRDFDVLDAGLVPDGFR